MSTRPEINAFHRRALIMQQFPCVAILGCSDSRVPIEIVFDMGLGDVFVIRVAGNLLDMSTTVRCPLTPPALTPPAFSAACPAKPPRFRRAADFHCPSPPPVSPSLRRPSGGAQPPGSVGLACVGLACVCCIANRCIRWWVLCLLKHGLWCRSDRRSVPFRFLPHRAHHLTRPRSSTQCTTLRSRWSSCLGTRAAAQSRPPRSRPRPYWSSRPNSLKCSR